MCLHGGPKLICRGTPGEDGAWEKGTQLQPVQYLLGNGYLLVHFSILRWGDCGLGKAG